MNPTGTRFSLLLAVPAVLAVLSIAFPAMADSLPSQTSGGSSATWCFLAVAIAAAIAITPRRARKTGWTTSRSLRRR